MPTSYSNTINYTLSIAPIFAPEITVSFDLAIIDKVDFKKNLPSNLPPGFIENFVLQVNSNE